PLTVARHPFARCNLAVLAGSCGPYGGGLDVGAAADLMVRPGKGVGIHAIDVACAFDQPVAAFAELAGSPFLVGKARRLQIQLDGSDLLVRLWTIALEFHDDAPWWSVHKNLVPGQHSDA